METIKERMRIDCDLTFTSLFEGINYLCNLHKIKTKYFVLIRVSIEQLFSAIIMEQELAQARSFWGFGKTMLFNSNLIKETWGKRIFFSCDRDLPKDYWEISCFNDGKQYILYSNGA